MARLRFTEFQAKKRTDLFDRELKMGQNSLLPLHFQKEFLMFLLFQQYLDTHK